jgi:hypothetical protein
MIPNIIKAIIDRIRREIAWAKIRIHYRQSTRQLTRPNIRKGAQA